MITISISNAFDIEIHKNDIYMKRVGQCDNFIKGITWQGHATAFAHNNIIAVSSGHETSVRVWANTTRLEASAPYFYVS